MDSITKLKNFLRRKFIGVLIFVKKAFGQQHIYTKLKSGDRLCVRINDRIGQGILVNKSFEIKTESYILSRITRGMTVIDIGANLGYFTVSMARAVGEHGRVIAVEPNPVMVEELKNNVRLNNLKNVVIEQIALSNENGQADFFNPELGSESHGSLQPNKTFNVKNKLLVSVEKTDDMMKRIDSGNVDFVKIDAEGAEYLIFQGSENMLTVMRPQIIFECAENLCEGFGHTVFDVLAYLSAKGYRVRQFDYGMWLGEPSKRKGSNT